MPKSWLSVLVRLANVFCISAALEIGSACGFIEAIVYLNSSSAENNDPHANHCGLFHCNITAAKDNPEKVIFNRIIASNVWKLSNGSWQTLHFWYFCTTCDFRPVFALLGALTPTRATFFSLCPDLLGAAEEVLPSLKKQGIRVFILREHCDVEGIESLSDKIRQASDEPLSPQLRANVKIKSPALYIYTSGTTGNQAFASNLAFRLGADLEPLTEHRKDIVLSMVNLSGLPKAAVINHERVWMAAFLQSFAGVRSDDTIYIYLPLYHSAGFLMGLCGAIEKGDLSVANTGGLERRGFQEETTLRSAPPLFPGITVALRRKFSASQFWTDCRKYNVTVIQYIGEIMRYLCNTPKVNFTFCDDHFSVVNSILYLMVGGGLWFHLSFSPLLPPLQSDRDRDHKVRLALGNGIRSDTWADFLERFGDIRISECYGATEGNIGFVNYIGKIGAIGKENFLHKVR